MYLEFIKAAFIITSTNIEAALKPACASVNLR